MSALIKAFKRLEYTNFLIKKKATGDLESFAKKMQLSKTALKEIIAQMREMGASIRYDRSRKSYYYSENGEFSVAKFMKYGEVLKREDVTSIGKPEDLCFSEKAIFVLCDELI